MANEFVVWGNTQFWDKVYQRILDDIKEDTESELKKQKVIEEAYNGLEGSESNIEFKFDNEPESCWTTVTPKWNWVWCNYRIKQT